MHAKFLQACILAESLTRFQHKEIPRCNTPKLQRNLQELTAASLTSAAAAALQAARAASSHPQLQQQPSYPLQALASATSGLAPGLLPKGSSLLTDHTQQQQLVENQTASGLDVHADARHADGRHADARHADGRHADVRHASYALGQEEALSSKHSVATEVDQLSSALAGQQQQKQQQKQKQLLHEGPHLPWSNDHQADSPNLQQQQQQFVEILESGIQSSDAGGSGEGGLKGAGGGQDAGGVGGAGEGQDEAAKAAYRQWSASFEACTVSCEPCLPAKISTCLVSLPQNTALML